MTPQEALVLCRYAKAACPQQAFDEYTPDAWADLLADLPFNDAQTALKAVVKRQPFVSPSEIREGVQQIRKERRAAYGPISPPDDLDPNDHRAYVRWLTETNRAIDDGELVRTGPRPELPRGNVHSEWWNN